MGSTKNAKRAEAKRAKRAHEPDEPVRRTDQPPTHNDEDPRIEEILGLIRSQRDEIARIQSLLAELVEARRLADRQVERSLVLQQRTNALVELLLGSAFDVELGEPRRR